MFERGVINLFEAELELQTNCPYGLAIKFRQQSGRWDEDYITYRRQQADRLADLERMLHLFSGKPIPVAEKISSVGWSVHPLRSGAKRI